MKPLVRHVFGVARAGAGHVLLEQRLAGPAGEQVRHHERGDDGDQADPAAGGEQAQPPPHAGVAEVVRVPGVAPQPRSMTLPRLAGSALNRASWASPTASKTSPTATDGRAERRPRRRAASRVVLGHLDRQRDEPHDSALRQVHHAQRVRVAVAGRPGEHRARSAGPRPCPGRASRCARPAAAPTRRSAAVTSSRRAASPCPADSASAGQRDGGEAEPPGHVDDAVLAAGRRRRRT